MLAGIYLGERGHRIAGSGLIVVWRNQEMLQKIKNQGNIRQLFNSHLPSSAFLPSESKLQTNTLISLPS